MEVRSMGDRSSAVRRSLGVRYLNAGGKESAFGQCRKVIAPARLASIVVGAVAVPAFRREAIALSHQYTRGPAVYYVSEFGRKVGAAVD